MTPAEPGDPEPVAASEGPSPARPSLSFGHDTQIIDTTVSGDPTRARPEPAEPAAEPAPAATETGYPAAPVSPVGQVVPGSWSAPAHPDHTAAAPAAADIAVADGGVPATAETGDIPVIAAPAGPVPGVVRQETADATVTPAVGATAYPATTVTSAGAPPYPVDPALTTVVPQTADAAATGLLPAASPVGLPRDPSAGAEVTTTFDARALAAGRRTERWVMVLSTLLGTLGIALAIAAAALDQLRYDQPGPCATYLAAHKGQAGFGCTATAKHIAVLAPAIGVPLLVVAALAVVWIPRWRPRGRLAWLGAYLVALVVIAVAVAAAYSALPQNG